MIALAKIGQWLSHRKIILLLLLIIALGGFLRFYDLGAESIGYEEAVSINVSSMDAASIVEEIPNHNHPPLYFIILHFWMSLLGTGEIATRSLSAIFGIN